MSKVVPLKIDTDLGKLPLKEKGLDMIDFQDSWSSASAPISRAPGCKQFRYLSLGIWMAGNCPQVPRAQCAHSFAFHDSQKIPDFC